ncbi:ArsR/SmtB family transcription factor [Alicyclobacillus sp. ALC3]|uniref:ArsR/SmtB family transcription factor n=1 Tax=Alicyclobacillus sp. ALC3 TaxID=2796143 RepID=UPI002378FD0E|nr:winged helix-turn-helix domain-containing protein [Alicyclobacillus sp. ALC3]WDL96733.1 winged helix-turn-helix transcriptional regulator [Alicyclobacillus sp. ALC3]
MKRYFVIDTPEQLKALSDPLRIRILTRIIVREATGKQLADEFQMSASKVHYHLRELENHGLAEIVRTEEKNGIIQKFYRAVAVDYVVSESLLPSGQWDSSMMQEVMANQLRIALARVYETDEQFFQVSPSEGGEVRPLIHGIWEVRASRQPLLEWKKKFRALMDELSDLEKTSTKVSPDDQSTDANELFFMTTIGFLTDVESFQVDKPGGPDGYQLHVDPATGEVTARQEKDDDTDHE